MSSTLPSHLNFAKALGIESVAAAVVFTIIYVLFLAFFARRSFTHPTYVHYVLTFFCIIRVAAFTIRSVLAGSESAGETLGLVIAEEILSGVGYFSLVYSAYTLVLDRLLLSDLPPLMQIDHPIMRLTQDRRTFRTALGVAVILGIVSATTINSNGITASTPKRLHIVSTALFLALTVLQTFQTIILARTGISGRSQYYVRGKDSIGIRYGNYILVLISLLLLVREVFVTATVTNTAKQDNEHFWYPLLAVPEVLVIILYTTPGLVPRRDELPGYSSVAGAAQF